MSFTLIKESLIPELDSVARLYTHDGTKARILSLANKDENKVFGITFRTPSANSTGVAHIMEHSVLCGSRKYPVKEPFVELMKGSLNTFLNAMTYPDKTCYPVASTNLADFRNLVDVYLDAVFYPAITEDTLRQEGWHYETTESGELEYKGVVYNEMKGAYSDPDGRLSDEVQASLYPDSPYSLDSGGDPSVIPNLTYSAFKAFHDTYYHPSNSFIFFYGDDDPEERLHILEGWLSPFTGKPADSLPGLQPRFDEPRHVRAVYDSGDNPEATSHVAVNWLLGPRVETATVESAGGKTGDTSDTQRSLELGILSHILASTPASPLKRALIESGLGEDITGSGFTDELRQMNYSIGLKGVKPGDEDKVESLILDTMREIAEKGLDPDTVDASLNTTEFALRERNTGRLPRGVAIMLGALGAWIYDGDPVDALFFEERLKAIRSEVESARAGARASGNPSEGHFESLVRRLFVENTHRTTVILAPDPEEGKRTQDEEMAALAKARAAMSEEEYRRVKDIADSLREKQEKPDSEEALASIPSLKLKDIEREVRILPIEIEKVGGTTILRHALPTSSIVYLDIGFDLHSLPERLVPYAGLLGRFLLETGTDKRDFVSLSQKIGMETGGMYGATTITSVKGQARSQAWFMLRSKVLAGREDRLFDILSEVLTGAQLDNRDRIMQIVLEEKAQAESGLVPSGHRVVASRLKSRFAEADRIGEKIDGLESLFFLRTLASRLESDWEGVRADLEEVRRSLLARDRCLINTTSDTHTLAAFDPQLRTFLAGLPAAAGGAAGGATGAPSAPGAGVAGGATTRPENPSAADAASAAARPGSPAGTLPDHDWSLGESPVPRGVTEGIAVPSQVNFVGKAANLFEAGYEYSGSIHVINKYLQSTWLWEKVRVQGGAYGGFSAFDRTSGVFTFLSYRDPALARTLESYDATAGFLASLHISPAELEKTIIGTIGDVDSYMLPDAKGYASMLQYLSGTTTELRQKTRNEILGTRPEDFRALAPVLEKAFSTAEIAVMASQETLDKAAGDGLVLGQRTRAL